MIYVIYHSPEWQILTDLGYLTWYVNDNYVASMLKE